MLPLHVPIKPSKWHEGALVFGALGVCLCVSSVSPPWWQSATFTVVILISTYRWLQRYVWLSHPLAIVQVRATVFGWHICLVDGSELSVHLSNGCRFLPNLIVLRMRCERNKLWWCLLLKDSAPTDAMRRLRVIGNWRPNIQIQHDI